MDYCHNDIEIWNYAQWWCSLKKREREIERKPHLECQPTIYVSIFSQTVLFAITLCKKRHGFCSENTTAYFTLSQGHTDSQQFISAMMHGGSSRYYRLGVKRLTNHRKKTKINPALYITHKNILFACFRSPISTLTVSTERLKICHRGAHKYWQSGLCEGKVKIMTLNLLRNSDWQWHCCCRDSHFTASKV